MGDERLNFYSIDEEYLKFLRDNFDDKVPEMNYDVNKKFFCGVVLEINDIKYFAPISHDTKKYKTSILIKHDEDIKSSIKFSFMVPVDDTHITYKDFSKETEIDYVKSKYLSECDGDEHLALEKAKKYVALLSIEHKFCNNNVQAIKDKALKVYKIGCNSKHWLNKNCCDFKKLEKAMYEYLNSEKKINEEDK